jgi:exodeoxyribonuclease-3
MHHARERNIGWRLDYFLVSDFAQGRIADAKIMTDVYGSDHAPVLLDIDI